MELHVCQFQTVSMEGFTPAERAHCVLIPITFSTHT
jgi:hypothetical protein